jgi:hypothetical protein
MCVKATHGFILAETALIFADTAVLESTPVMGLRCIACIRTNLDYAPHVRFQLQTVRHRWYFDLDY